MEADKKKDNNGKERDITKVKVQMRHPVREDLLRYLQSNIAEKEDKIGWFSQDLSFRKFHVEEIAWFFL